MAGKTIKGSINHTVTLGSSSYPSPLSITSTGDIFPGSAGATGIYLPARATLATITNQGFVDGGGGASAIYNGGNGGTALELNSAAYVFNANNIDGGAGGQGQYGGAGGTGVDVQASSTIVNAVSGFLSGGQGGYGQFGGGNGGLGVNLATFATLTNGGIVQGGSGGITTNPYAVYYGSGAGGTGVRAAQGAIVNNNDIINGGLGGNDVFGSLSNGGMGGTGVVLQSGAALINSHYIVGGAGGSSEFYTSISGVGGVGGAGGTGVALYAADAVNTGRIFGGYGGFGVSVGGSGGAGAAISNYSNLTNTGTIFGGAGGAQSATSSNVYAGSGGFGVLVESYSTLVNSGHIYGGRGAGASAYLGVAGGGGGGVYLSTGTLMNTGTISGGAGGDASGSAFFSSKILTGAGGAGLIAGSSFIYGPGISIANYGLIRGGTAGTLSSYAGRTAMGGMGVDLTNATLSNHGTIIGGAGGVAQQSSNYNYGGAGGAGVQLSSTSRLVNSGAITGGTGGANTYYGVTGGAGVVVLGGTFVNSGTVTGGAGGAARLNGAQGDAVYLGGTTAGTLIINPGAVFKGSVVASASAANILEVAGSSTTALKGIGTEFIGFSAVSFASGASRTIEGSIAALGTIDGFATHDTIILDGYTTTLADTSFNGPFLFLYDGFGSDIILPHALAKDIIITDAGGRTTIAAVAGTFAHTLVSGTEQFILSGGTVSNTTVKSGGVDNVYAGGTAASTTIAGGDLLLQINGKLTGGVTFSTVTGGTLTLDSSTMPTTTISGFIAGDTIDLAGVVYNKYDTVAVNKAGVVTVVAPGTSYNLNIAGATVGEKDFVFGPGSVLTKSAAAIAAPGDFASITQESISAWMGFIRPPALAAVSAYSSHSDLVPLLGPWVSPWVPLMIKSAFSSPVEFATLSVHAGYPDSAGILNAALTRDPLIGWLGTDR